MDRSGDDRVAEHPDDCAGDIIIRHADPYGFFIGTEEPRNILIGVQDKSEGAGQGFLQYSENFIINRSYVIGDMPEIMADEREMGFFGLYPPDPAYPVNSFGIGDITAEAINCIRWIDDDTTFFQYVYYLLKGSLIGVFGIYFDQHNG